MKMHDFELVTSNEDGTDEDGSAWLRRAVPGGWLYWAEVTTYCNTPNEMLPRDHVEGAVFVPDPTAEHVVNAGKGAM